MERIVIFNKTEMIGQSLSTGCAPEFVPTKVGESNYSIVRMVDDWLVKEQKNKKFHITFRSIEKDAEGYLSITLMFIV